MLRLSETAAKLIINIMVQQGLDPLRDVFEVVTTNDGFAVSFTRDLTPTEIVNGLRISYRGARLEIDIAKSGQMGLIFTAGKK
jgi:hypothetical protein